MKNRWDIYKDIQKRFWYKYELLITRNQAAEVSASLKHQAAMTRLDGRYVSTRDSDDIRGASATGVKYGGYQVWYSAREWNNAVIAGEFGEVKNPYADLWSNDDYPMKGELGIDEL